MREVLVCCGMGGTGKTTTAAALALAHAAAGHRTVVLTIDPARRLADALGIGDLTNKPTLVPLENCRGSLHALMLDRARAWDDLVEQLLPAEAPELLENAYYQAVSTRLSGSHEFMAIAKLWELHTAGEWDVLVLDTPPAQHLEDFFSAPDRIRRIFDRSVFRTLLGRERSLRGLATRQIFGMLHRLAGEDVLADLSRFLDLLGNLALPFRERAAAVSELLVDPNTRYFLLAAADAPLRDQPAAYLDKLRERGATVGGLIVTRIAGPPPAEIPARQELLTLAQSDASWPEQVDQLLALPARQQARRAKHLAGAQALVDATGRLPIWLVPDMPGGIADPAGLFRLAPYLPPTSPVRLHELDA